MQEGPTAPPRAFSPGFELLLRAIPAFAPWLVRFYIWNLRLHYHDFGILEGFVRERKPFVAVVWHEYMMFAHHMMTWPTGRTFTILSSRSRDGELSTRLLRRLGHRVERGSSSVGGMEGLRGIVRNIRQGYPAVFVADGPRGPRRVSKMGPVLAASLARVPIIPFGCAMSRSRRLRNWDRTAFPIPGSVLVLGFGPPIDVPARASEEEYEAIRARVDRSMEALEADCERAARG